MKFRTKSTMGILALVLVLTQAEAFGQADSISKKDAAKYLLAAIKAFRTVYVRDVIEHVKDVGVQPKEQWIRDPHAIMLPFQFVKVVGVVTQSEVNNLEMGLISLTPIYSSNFPQTQAEVNALKTMVSNPNQKIVTFHDGDQFKGMAGDFAFSQVCIDCHNQHPRSPKKDFKKGDLMGAIIIRLRE